MIFEKLIMLLENENAKFRVVEHLAEGNSERVAEIRGTEVGQGAKAMLCQAKENPDFLILAILPGDKKIDFKKLARVVGCKKTSFASPDAAMSETGCVIGAIPPFSFSENIKLVADPELFARYDEIAFNAGLLDKSIIMNSADYTRIAKPLLSEISS